jgi:hypothetical protein
VRPTFPFQRGRGMRTPKGIPDSVYQMVDAMYDGIASVAERVQ